MNFLFLKYLHIFCVATSFSLFFVRGFWILNVYPPATERSVRMLPHAVDALLVLSAAAMLSSVPWLEWPAWMSVKLALIAVYIVLALATFRANASRLQKGTAWLLGVVLFLYITTVAVLKHPFGILSVMWPLS